MTSVTTEDRRILTQGIVDEWVDTTEGWFSYEMMDRQLNIRSLEGRANRRKYVQRLKERGVVVGDSLRQGWFRRVIKPVKDTSWVKADRSDFLTLRWPYGIEDGTSFGLENVKIYPGDIILIAGVTQSGKTAVALNLCVLNTDEHRCYYISSELEGPRMADRMSYFDWIEWRDENGEPKFDYSEAHSDYEDAIEPDSINIIDYIDLGEDHYKIVSVINRIDALLNRGLAIIFIQKPSHRDIGVGGEGTIRKPSLVLAIDYEQLTIVKAKSWHRDYRRDGTKYKFKLVHGASKFHDIRLVD